MRIAEIIERLGRTVFEAPFGKMSQVMGDSPEVAEIRIAVLDEVKKKIQRAGGKALFPYNVVRICIHAGGGDATVFERDFFRKFFDEEVRKSLSKDACRFPDDLRVEIRVTDSEPGDDDGWLLIETIAQDPLPAPPAMRGIDAYYVSARACVRRRCVLDQRRNRPDRRCVAQPELLYARPRRLVWTTWLT